METATEADAGAGGGNIKKILKKGFKKLRKFWDRLIGHATIEEVLQIAVIGPESGGKSVFFNALHESTSVDDWSSVGNLHIAAVRDYSDEEDVGALLIQEYREANEVFQQNIPEATVELIRAQGFINTRKQRVPFVIYDSPGEELKKTPPVDLYNSKRSNATVDFSKWPIVYQAVFLSDLLIVMLPPEFVADHRKYSRDLRYGDKGALMNRLERCIEMFMNHNPDGMIAITYSKCDEYGSVITGPRRVVSNRNLAAKLDAFRRKGAVGDSNEKNVFWQALLNTLEGSKQNGLKDGWKEVRKTILNKTSSLWSVMRFKNTQAVNGYFIATKPVLGQPSNWLSKDAGYRQIFADYWHHREHINSKPTIDKTVLLSPYVLLILFVALIVMYFFVD